MGLISRYILKSHAGPFIFGFATVVFLFLMQFLMKFLDELVGKGLSEWVIFQLIVYNMAWMVILAIPMGVLFSTLMAFGGMSASHEVTIVKASGGSLLKMMRPVIIAGAVITVFAFWFNDYVLPESNHKAKALMIDIKKKKPTFSLESGKFSNEISGYTIFPRRVDSASGKMYGVTIYSQKSVKGRNVISADSGIVAFTKTYENLVLKLFDGEIHKFDFNEPDNYRIVGFDDYQIALDASGFDFERTDRSLVSRGDRELKIKDMEQIVFKANEKKEEFEKEINERLDKHLGFIFTKDDLMAEKLSIKKEEERAEVKASISRAEALQKVRQRLNFLKTNIRVDITQKEHQEYKIRKYEVEIYKKYAIPFACFIFVFVGCPLGIMTKGGNFGISAGISLLFYIFYWACLIGGEKLADRGVLSPFLSMWAGNFLIGVMGLILTLRVNYESLPGLDDLKYLFGRKK